MKFLLEHAAAGLFADPGTGKTSAVLAAFKILKKKGLARKMLVVAPLRPAYLVWPRENKKWIDFLGLRAVVLHGPKKAEALASDADIYIINPEGLDWLLGATRVMNARGRISVTVDVRAFRSFGFDTLCIDELSKFKNHASGRHKALKEVLGTFSRRWGLTGSPAANGLMDLFGEIYMLDMGRTFGPYITHFRSKYFVPSFNGFDWHLAKGADQLIYDRIAPLVCRLDANDYVEMPALVSNEILIQLPPPVRRIYDDMEQDMFVRVEANAVVAANMGAAMMKCRQIANGGLYLDDDPSDLLKKFKVQSKGRAWVDLHMLKVDAVEDLVDELGGKPLFVAYEFHHDLARLQGRFGKDVPFIGGGTSPKRADDLERLWNAGKLPLLLGHPQSVGHGLNFQEAGNHVCFHSITHDYDTYDQFIRRVWRQGNANDHMFVHHILADDTVDRIIMYALRHKKRTQDALHDAMKRLAKGAKKSEICA